MITNRSSYECDSTQENLAKWDLLYLSIYLDPKRRFECLQLYLTDDKQMNKETHSLECETQCQETIATPFCSGKLFFC